MKRIIIDMYKLKYHEPNRYMHYIESRGSTFEEFIENAVIWLSDRDGKDMGHVTLEALPAEQCEAIKEHMYLELFMANKIPLF